GATVRLSSSNPSIAIMSPTIIVPAGRSSATFTINTSVVAAIDSAMISAAYGGTRKVATLTLLPPSSQEFYVSPIGVASGVGRFANPWDLQTALNQPSSVDPGAPIFLRGGPFSGKFLSKLGGKQSDSIPVCLFSGEWARIDGNKTSTLPAAIGSTSTSD